MEQMSRLATYAIAYAFFGFIVYGLGLWLINKLKGCPFRLRRQKIGIARNDCGKPYNTKRRSK